MALASLLVAIKMQIDLLDKISQNNSEYRLCYHDLTTMLAFESLLCLSVFTAICSAQAFGLNRLDDMSVSLFLREPRNKTKIRNWIRFIVITHSKL